VKKIMEKREGHGKISVKKKGGERQKGEKERANGHVRLVRICIHVFVCESP